MKKLHLIPLFALVAGMMALTQCASSPSKPAAPESAAEDENQTFTVNGVTFSMSFVGGGTFTMGATLEQGDDVRDDEKPAHRVTLSDFYIGETEVTQALWEAVMSENPSDYKGANLPVQLVSREDCEDFIDKLNALTGQKFRLPTEAEWEYAARGGSKSKGFKYSGSNTLSDVAWFEETDSIHPVKEKAPNELGIYDMSGNVGEWCYDGYSPYSDAEQTNPQGLPPDDADAVVIRGGGWGSEPHFLRVSSRSSSPGYISVSVGFRLAL